MRKAVLKIAFCLFLSVFSFTACKAPVQKEPEKKLRPVRFVELKPDSGIRVRTFSGLTRAGMASRMSFRVSGTLQKLQVKVGDILEPGQLIAQLDFADFQLQVQEAEAALSRAEAEARNADAVYGRLQALYERRNASRSELDAARAGFESSSAAVRSIENRLELARRQLSYAYLLAPDRCAVAAVPVEENENVAAGQAIALVNCGSGLDVRIAVPALYIAALKEGMQARVRVDALKDKLFSGVISEVGVAAVGLETTFPVTIRLENPDEKILPGMAAEVDLFMNIGAENSIYVPFRSVGEDSGGHFVFCLKLLDEGRAEVFRRDVSLGAMSSEGFEIVEGLDFGDLVVTAGVARIYEGLEVLLWKEEIL